MTANMHGYNSRFAEAWQAEAEASDDAVFNGVVLDGLPPVMERIGRSGGLGSSTGLRNSLASDTAGR